MACGKAAAGDTVALDFATGSAGTSSAGMTGFGNENSVVLRCGSVDLTGHSIVVTTSKSKNLKATSLVFVSPPAGDAAKEVGIAVVPVTGKEYEYDSAQAKFYLVTLASAQSAVNAYGIPFADWQVGAANGSEKFPCCE